MDFYQSMLANGAILETPEEIERKRRQRTMLPRTRSSVGGTLTNSVKPGDDPRSMGDAAILESIRLYSQEDDYSEAQDYAKRRSNEGQDAMLNALAAGYAGQRFQPVQAMYLKRAMAAQEPMRVGNATIGPDGTVMRDAGAGRLRKATQLQQLGQFYTGLADRQDARNEAAELRRALAPTGSWQHVQDPNTGEVVLYNTKTGEKQPFGAVSGGAPSMPGAAVAPSATGFNIPQGGMPKLTEVQDKARFFAQNMAEALPGLNKLITNGYMPNRMDQFAAGPPSPGYLGATANALTPRGAASPAGREFYTEGRKVLAAILRKESGAAITDDEWTSYGPIYLPWPGDDAAEVQRKMSALNTMANNMAMSSGPVYRYWNPTQFGGVSATDDGVVDLTPGKN